MKRILAVIFMLLCSPFGNLWASDLSGTYHARQDGVDLTLVIGVEDGGSMTGTLWAGPDGLAVSGRQTEDVISGALRTPE